MRILVVSYVFPPMVGGIETIARLLLPEFVAAGHDVQVITHTPADGVEPWLGCPVYRRPSRAKQWQLARWADVVYYHNPAFTYPVPALAGRPVLTSLHTWVKVDHGSRPWVMEAKLAGLRRLPCIANSRAMAAHLGAPCVVIENAFDASAFHATVPWEERQGAAFVGRLVSDKGADVAVAAMARLRDLGVNLPLTLIGGGPEAPALAAQVAQLGLTDRVRLTGSLSPAALAEELNRVKYLLVPSRWVEPYGIVALEGMACGCVVLGTRQGGLVDAIGPGGWLFGKDRADELAELLVSLERTGQAAGRTLAEARAAQLAHLAAHTPRAIARRYLAAMEAAADGSWPF